MKKEFIIALTVLLHSLGLQSAELTQEAIITSIPKELKDCIVLATDPKDRKFVKMVFEMDCFDRLPIEQQKKSINLIKSINLKSSIPLLTQP